MMATTQFTTSSNTTTQTVTEETDMKSMDEMIKERDKLDAAIAKAADDKRKKEEKEAAEKDRAKTAALESTKKDVNDLLNQVVLKLKDIKAYNPDSYYDDDEGSNASENYLGAIKSFVQRSLKDEHSATRSEYKYYQSSC